MANELIDLRGAVSKQLADELNKSIAPMIEAMRAQGMSDDDINIIMNRAFFDEFRGLHGFPNSHRP